MTMHSIRVILLEEYRLLRDYLTVLLTSQSDLTLIAAVGHPRDLVHPFQSWHPQVLLLDVQMSSQDWVGVVDWVTQASPQTQVIAMFCSPAQTQLLAGIQAGVAGFLLKEASPDEVVQTLRLVAQGTPVLPPSLRAPLFAQLRDQASRPRTVAGNGVPRLTPREQEILTLIAAGLSNKDIARRLHLATDTVKSHIHHLLEKFAVQTRTQLVPYAQTLTPPPPAGAAPDGPAAPRQARRHQA